MPPEAAAPGDLVFPQTALRFMHRHAGVQTDRGAKLRRRQTLLVQTVARLVNGTEERIERLLRLEARRHSHVAARAGTKWMQRNIEPAARVVEAQPRRDFTEKRLLPFPADS